MILLQFEYAARQASSSYTALIISFHVLAAIFGLVGGLRIYNQWQLHGRHLHIDRQIVGWFGASLFFLVADELISQALL
jgi:Domain of unknown function (DUF4134)